MGEGEELTVRCYTMRHDRRGRWLRSPEKGVQPRGRSEGSKEKDSKAELEGVGAASREVQGTGPSGGLERRQPGRCRDGSQALQEGNKAGEQGCIPEALRAWPRSSNFTSWGMRSRQRVYGKMAGSDLCLKMTVLAALKGREDAAGRGAAREPVQ